MRTKRILFISLGFLGIFSCLNPAGAQEKDQAVLNLFKEITAVPRCFMYERNMGIWLQNWARENGFQAEADSTGNVVIRVPATKGYAQAPIIVLQSHMDMVCEKSSTATHDFFKDPIRIKQEGEWLAAEQTTLGADDAIGMALALAIAKDSPSRHPALELVFTVGEESGFRGINALDGSFIKGRVLINLDSELEGAITIGSAGGRTTGISLPVKSEKLPKSCGIYTLKVDGLQGGHSGVDIHLKRGNAIKILARVLETLKSHAEIRLIELKGGSRVNAIPRQAEAVLAFDSVRSEKIRKIAKDLEQILHQELALTDKGLTVTLAPFEREKPSKGFTVQDSSRVISLLAALPDGVANMNPRFKDVVETSNNLGILQSNADSITLVSNQRSSSLAGLGELTAKIRNICFAAGATTNDQNSYDPWQPNPDSALLKRGKGVYRKLFGREPLVTVIHGGLECGVMAAKFRNMEIIAIGPTIQGAHAPGERVHIPSIGKVRKFLVELLASYK
ncbi:MAG: aminoacyl-histidine dipeptidase [Desulfobacteraceae bacterium]|nr:MAG: aminoacyl-histidine dipeptidase [Desulfobacteraceae bacterium]